MERPCLPPPALLINLKVGVSLDHSVSLRFVLFLAFQTCWETFQAENNIRSTLASALHLP